MSISKEAIKSANKSNEAIAREAASDFVYKVYAWRGRSPAFMQTQVNRLTDSIQSALDKAVLTAMKRYEGRCPICGAESRAAQPQEWDDTKRLDWLETRTYHGKPSPSKWANGKAVHQVQDIWTAPGLNLRQAIDAALAQIKEEK